MFAHQSVIANRAALRLPSDALWDLSAEADKWQRLVSKVPHVDMDVLLDPIGAQVDLPSQAVTLYRDEGAGISLTPCIEALRCMGA